MRYRLPVFIAIVLIQLGFLFYTALSSQLVLATGRTVKLKCVPVDPRSLVSGDYVDLRYTISEVDPEEFARLSGGLPPASTGESYYLRLESDAEGYARITQISKKSDQFKKDNALFVKGVVTYTFSAIEFTYGIEHYYVPQFTGLDIEAESENTWVEAALDTNGRAVLRSLFVNGKKVTFY